MFDKGTQWNISAAEVAHREVKRKVFYEETTGDVFF